MNMSLGQLNIKSIDSKITSFIILATMVVLVWVFFQPFNSIFSDFLLLPSFLVYLLMMLLLVTSCIFSFRWMATSSQNSPWLKKILMGILFFLFIYTGHAIYAFATNRFQHFHWIPIFGICFLSFFIHKKERFRHFPIFISFLVLGMGIYESILAILQFILWRYPELHSNLLLYPYQRFCFMHDGISYIKSVIRPMGTFDSPITLGIFLAALLPLSIWLFPRNNRISTLLSFLGISLIIVALALTYSRASLLSALSVVGLCAITYLYIKKKSSARISLAVVVFLIIWTLGNHWAYERWIHGIKLQDKSIVNRVTIWKNSKNIIFHNPVLGVGLGNFGKTYEQYNPMPANITEDMKDQYQYTTNNYWLSLWCEVGTIGLVSFFAIIIALSTLVWKEVKCFKPSTIALMSLWSSLIILILNGFSNSSLGHPFLNLWMWISVGLIFAQLTKSVSPEKV